MKVEWVCPFCKLTLTDEKYQSILFDFKCAGCLRYRLSKFVKVVTDDPEYEPGGATDGSGEPGS